ncbi:MAG: DUF2975 domain-containing protein [Bacillota bacterium]
MKMNPVKFKKMARVLRIILNICLWAGAAAGAAATIATMVFIFRPELLSGLAESGRMSVSLGFSEIVTYRLGSDILDASKFRPVLYTIVPAIAILLAMYVIIVKQIVDILKTIERDCPFAEENSKRLGIIGTVMLVGSVVFNITQSAMATAVIMSYNIPNFDVKYSIDKNMLLMGLLVLILAGVFKYGSFLQNEYDSTL